MSKEQLQHVYDAFIDENRKQEIKNLVASKRVKYRCTTVQIIDFRTLTLGGEVEIFLDKHYQPFKVKISELSIPEYALLPNQMTYKKKYLILTYPPGKNTGRQLQTILKAGSIEHAKQRFRRMFPNEKIISCKPWK